MGVLRASVIIYDDLELLGYLLGLSVVGYLDFVQAARRGTPFPDLYAGRIRYQREPPGSEVWQTPRFTFASCNGDCEDLAAGWRVPQLWTYGETGARPFVKRVSPTLRHIQVMRADGSIEDPSLALGMHDNRDPQGLEAKAELARIALHPPIQTPDEPLPWHLPSFDALDREVA